MKQSVPQKGLKGLPASFNERSHRAQKKSKLSLRKHGIKVPSTVEEQLARQERAKKYDKQAIEQESACSWSVPSQTLRNQTYEVVKRQAVCPKHECGPGKKITLCPDLYTCTCPDKIRPCKHIIAVHDGCTPHVLNDASSVFNDSCASKESKSSTKSVGRPKGNKKWKAWFNPESMLEAIKETHGSTLELNQKITDNNYSEEMRALVNTMITTAKENKQLTDDLSGYEKEQLMFNLKNWFKPYRKQFSFGEMRASTPIFERHEMHLSSLPSSIHEDSVQPSTVHELKDNGHPLVGMMNEEKQLKDDGHPLVGMINEKNQLEDDGHPLVGMINEKNQFEDDGHPLVGMINEKNDCFLLSTLQAIFASPVLRRCIVDHDAEKREETKDGRDMCLGCALKESYNQAFQCAKNQTIFHPSLMKRQLPLLLYDYPWEPGSQFDAHELIGVIIEHLASQDCKEIPLVTEFKLQSSVTCNTCNNTTFSPKESHNTLVVDRQTSVQESIDQFFAVDVLEGNNEFLCNTCKALVERAEKKYVLDKAPAVLILSVRFERNDLGYKEEANMDLRLQKSITISNVEYRLVGFVSHLGPCLNSGHYTATIVVGDKIFECNDEQVTELREFPHCSSEVMFLIYERESTTSLVPEPATKDSAFNSKLDLEPDPQTQSKRKPQPEPEPKPQAKTQTKPQNEDRRNLVKKKKTEKICHKNYTEYLGQLEIPSTQWMPLWDSTTHKCNNRPAWSFLLKKTFETTFDKLTCKMNFGSSGLWTCDKKGRNHLSAYMVCGSGECKHFALSSTPILNKTLVFEVRFTGRENHTEALSKTRALKGVERVVAKGHLSHMPPKDYQDKQVAEARESHILANNWEGIKSDAVLRTAKYEIMSEQDLAQDDFVDIVMKRRKGLKKEFEKRFIQIVGEPLHVYLYSKQQILCILNFFRMKQKISLYLDATGSLVRGSPHDRKRVFVYSGVVRANGIYIPLLELISSEHDNATIGSFLSIFRQFVVVDCNRKWPIVGRVVTDCSFALIHAVLNSWNKLTLHEYLIIAYKLVTPGASSSQNMYKLIIIHLCKNHWSKNTSINLKSFGILGIQKRFIMEAMDLLGECDTLQQFDNLFHSFVTVLMSDAEGDAVVDALRNLNFNRKPQYNEYPDPDTVNLAEQLDDHNLDPDETLYGTPFHIHCRKIIDSFQPAEGNLKNVLYCPVFINEIFMRNHCAALLPLWTRLLIGIRGKWDKEFDPSNASVEGFFKEKKRKTHKTAHNKVGRYVDIEEESVVLKIKRVQFRIRTDGKKINSESDESDPDDPPPLPEDMKKAETTTDTIPLNVTTKANETWCKRKETPKGGRYKERSSMKNLLSSDNKALETWKRSPKDAVKPSLGAYSGRFSKSKRILTYEGDSGSQLKAESLSCDERMDEESLLYQGTYTADAEQALQVSNLSVYVPEATSVPLLSFLSETEKSFVRAKGDADSLMYIYSNEKKPIYTKEFLALITNQMLSSAIMDNCLHCLQKLFSDPSYVVVPTVVGNQLSFPGSTECTLTIQEDKTYFIPIRGRSFGWSLVSVKISTLEPSSVSMWHDCLMSKEAKQELYQSFYNLVKNFEKMNITFEISRLLLLTEDMPNHDSGLLLLHIVDSALCSGNDAPSSFNAQDERIRFAKLCIAEAKSYQLARHDRSSLVENQNSNGLFKDWTYYAVCETPDCIAAAYGQGIRPLLCSDIHRLVTNKWLTTSIIDAAIHVYMQTTPGARDKFVNVTCSNGGQIFGDKIPKSFPLNEISICNKTLLIPYNLTQTHWTFAVADVGKKEYCNLDPLCNVGSTKGQSTFLRYLEKRNKRGTEKIDLKGWKYRELSFPCQSSKDRVNCGVYVVYYAARILGVNLKDERLNTSEALLDFRRDIAQTLLSNATQMDHLCVVCGKDEYRVWRCLKNQISPMVECSKCLRWVHRQCHDVIGLKKSIQEIEAIIYSCPLCTFQAKARSPKSKKTPAVTKKDQRERQERTSSQ